MNENQKLGKFPASVTLQTRLKQKTLNFTKHCDTHVSIQSRPHHITSLDTITCLRSLFRVSSKKMFLYFCISCSQSFSFRRQSFEKLKQRTTDFEGFEENRSSDFVWVHATILSEKKNLQMPKHIDMKILSHNLRAHQLPSQIL